MLNRSKPVLCLHAIVGVLYRSKPILCLCAMCGVLDRYQPILCSCAIFDVLDRSPANLVGYEEDINRWSRTVAKVMKEGEGTKYPRKILQKITHSY